MDQNSSGANYSQSGSRHFQHHQQHQQQQQQHWNNQQQQHQHQYLPPPSQLHLTPGGPLSSPSSNILPPIPTIPTSSTRVQYSNIQPAPSQHQQWNNQQRTSSSRDEPHHHHLREREAAKREMSQQQQQQQVAIGNANGKDGHEDPMPSTSDFVKKLYKMLEDPSFQQVVCWGPHGDCFVVKDMNEFTKSILPRMFKHSNFASFVRQLNKYDFHKVKNTDDNQFGEHSWTFRHPDFHADRRDALENIKRKVPTQRKSTSSALSALPSSSSQNNPSHPSSSSSQNHPSSSSSSLLPTLAPSTSLIQNPPSPTDLALELEVRRLKDEGEDLRGRLRALERNYENVLVEMVGFQRGMAQQDGLMQSLIAYFLGSESGKLKATSSSGSSNQQHSSSSSPQIQAQIRAEIQQQQQQQQQQQASSTSASQSQSQQSYLSSMSDQNPFLPQQTSSRIIGGAGNVDVGRATLMQMNELSRRAAESGGAVGGGGSAGIWSGLAGYLGTGAGEESSSSSSPKLSRAEALARIEELHRERVGQGVWGAGSPLAQPPSGRRKSLTVVDATPGPGPSSSSADDYPMQPAPPSSSSPSSVEPSSSSSSAQQQQQQWGLGLLDEDTLSPSIMSHEGLQVYTVGHLMPRDTLLEDPNGNWTFDPSMLGGMGMGTGFTPTPEQQQQRQAEAYTPASGGYSSQPTGEEPEEVVMPSPQIEIPPQLSSSSSSSNAAAAVAPTPSSSSSSPSSSSSQKLRVRRSTFVPGWAVPPRVLLVDDDAVSRKLSSKFLQVFGCTTDVAVDGVSAVNKMNLEKYDLVLMDIVMPKLDGVSATSLIRKFDHMTPIISMTSNSKPNEIMTYYSSGMNDILPKPFTKEGLLDMLEKHLMHLKVIQQLQRVPKPLGVPPLNDPSFEQALTSGASASQLIPVSQSPGPFNFSSGDDNGRINPLAGMGLTDEQYNIILQNIVNGESFMGGMNFDGLNTPGGGGGGGEKRPLDDSGDGRDGKRSRFEVIE